MSTTDVARYDAPTAMPAKLEYARTLSASGLLPDAYKRKPENVLWAIEYGAMLNLSPMVAITMVHVISGKPTASAGLVSALVRRAGHKLRVHGDHLTATAQVIRSDDPDYVFEVTWTIERAKAAQLTSNPNWTKYPAAMLSARAITEVARLACQEALLGMQYTPEEMGATVDEDGQPIATVTTLPARDPAQPPAPRVVTPEPDPEITVDLDSLRGAIADAATEDDLKALWQANEKHLTGHDRGEISGLIKAMIDALAEPAVDAELVEQ